MAKSANPSLPRIIGHRGAMGHAPENTLASFRKAAELGATCVEFDAKLSQDKEPIVFHDDDLDRTTDGHGPVAENTLAQLQSLDAGAWFGGAYVGERIPTLGQAIDVLKDLNLGANVEIKPSPGREVESGLLIAEFLNIHWPDDLPGPLISSFKMDSLIAARAVAPDIPRALNTLEITPDWRKRMEAAGATSFHVLERILSTDIAAEITAAGYTLRSFTVNQPEVANRLFSWGIEGVFTDFPDRYPDDFKSR